MTGLDKYDRTGVVVVKVSIIDRANKKPPPHNNRLSSSTNESYMPTCRIKEQKWFLLR